MFDLKTIRRPTLVGVFSVALLAGLEARAATKTVDLDGNAANGAESQCDTNVTVPYPTEIQNTITNRSNGNAFNFSWPSAGPGGFTANVKAGTSGGVGAIWKWTTYESVVGFTGSDCASDICLSKTGGPDLLPGTCSLACPDGVSFRVDKRTGTTELGLSWSGGQGPYKVTRSTSPGAIAAAANALFTTGELLASDVPPAGTTVYYQVRGTGCAANATCTSNAQCGLATEGFCANRGPFGVPGRSLVSSGVTVSSGSLTSSLIQFFSPPQEIFRATSTATAGGVVETLTNVSGDEIVVTTPASPPGCCPASEGGAQLNCEGVCVFYLWDPNNCGACGNVCGEGSDCSDGYCTTYCDEGQELCGEACVSTWSDPNNCGACGNVCGENEYCSEGSCRTSCDEGQTLCFEELCVDTDSDIANCGACGNACPDQNGCCVGGECFALCQEGWTFDPESGSCVDTRSDSGNCGAVGNVCGDGSCCYDGECVGLLCEGEGFPAEGGWTLCGNQCVPTAVDDGNCGGCGDGCGQGYCCNGTLDGESGPSCGPVCAESRTQCGEECVDLSADPANCNDCGAACGEGECCAGETGCIAACPAEETLCEDGCTNTASDPGNCGGCGVVCDYYESCCQGECVLECEGEQSSPHPSSCPAQVPAEPLFCAPQPGPLPGVCPNPSPTSPAATQCDYGVGSKRIAFVQPGSRPRLLDEGGPVVAPVCQTEETTVTIPQGGTVTTCTPGGPLFKEVPAAIDVCGDSIPGVAGSCNNAATKVTTGTFNRFVTDDTTPVGDAFVTPFAVHVVSDTSGDGLLEPGETASVIVEVVNAGPMDITGASATIDAPSIDLTEDGLVNPVGLVVGGGAVSFGTIRGTPAATTCEAPPPQAAPSASAFTITVPPDHPGDTSHPLTLTVNGTVAGRTAESGPFTMTVPFNLGIADGCNAAANSRDFDGLKGMLGHKLAKLVPTGDAVPFPADGIKLGKKLSFRLRVKCGSRNLGNGDVDPPQIVALSEAKRGPIDVSTLYEEKQKAYTTLFVFDDDFILNNGDDTEDDDDDDDDSWEYKLRTSPLGTGTYTITIRIAGRKDYVTGFVLR